MDYPWSFTTSLAHVTAFMALSKYNSDGQKIGTMQPRTLTGGGGGLMSGSKRVAEVSYVVPWGMEGSLEWS
jgi:hypothetical protein